jgi:hypothetical protein
VTPVGVAPEAAPEAAAAQTTSPSVPYSGPVIELHHGTAHEVIEFEERRINSGEGAQVFGWGIYLAESPTVAAGYKKTVGAKHGKTGNAYQVAFRADRDTEILDWDKTLSEQNNAVKQKLADLFQQYREFRESQSSAFRDDAYAAKFLYADKFYQWLGDKLNREERPYTGEPQSRKASRELNNRGVKGIKYLDAESRGEGKPVKTQNFVSFNPKDLVITHKNGEPVTTARPEQVLEAGAPAAPGTAPQGQVEVTMYDEKAGEFKKVREKATRELQAKLSVEENLLQKVAGCLSK